jgi:amino acid transporter
MKHFFLLLLLAVFSLPQNVYAQKQKKEKKEWIFKHSYTGKVITLAEGQRMKVTWLLNGKKQSTKAKLYNIDQDTVSFIKDQTRLDLARKDVVKITFKDREESFLGAAGGAVLIMLAAVILVVLVIVSVIMFFVWLISLGSTSEPKKFNTVPVLALAAVGLFAIIISSFQKTKIHEPFGENWIMQTPPTHLDQIP